MTIERISTNSRMSKIVKHNGTAYLCGQVAKDRNADIHTQVTGMLEKVDELLETAGPLLSCSTCDAFLYPNRPLDDLEC